VKTQRFVASGLFMVITILYDRRAKFEEDIMLHTDSYASYLRRVRFRFIPGIC